MSGEGPHAKMEGIKVHTGDLHLSKKEEGQGCCTPVLDVANMWLLTAFSLLLEEVLRWHHHHLCQAKTNTVLQSCI